MAGDAEPSQDDKPPPRSDPEEMPARAGLAEGRQVLFGRYVL
jgi:hypothetical protein